MKKALLILAVLSFIQFEAFSSHLLGGEITWTCQSNGKFVFKLVLYRDCSGIPIPTGTQTLDVWGNPGLTSISLPNWTTHDLTSCQPAYNCASANPPVGAVEEGVYTSNPITLNGVPPAGGWVFSWTSCCRSGSLTNLVPGGFTMRAVMYPNNGQNTNPCYDNSPAFAEKPLVPFCTGYPATFNNLCYDPDGDSLVFSWGMPLESTVNSPPSPWVIGSNPPLAIFNSPYTYNQPLPYSPPNNGIVIDPLNGNITFQSDTLGYFNICFRATSYRNGIKLSEIFREYPILITADCDTTIAGTPNLPPVIVPPFADSSGNFTLFADTVIEGDLETFTISVSDSAIIVVNGVPHVQTITLQAYGTSFGTNFSDTSSGCPFPPCAVLDSVMPLTGIIGTSVDFSWQTTLDHVNYQSCFVSPVNYTFNFYAGDDACPLIAKTYQPVSLTVVPRLPRPVITYSNDTLICHDTGFSYQWYSSCQPLLNDTNITLVSPPSGFYQVEIQNQAGNKNYSYVIFVPVPLGIIQKSFTACSVHPNPASDILEVEFTANENHDVTLYIYDVTGRNVLEKIIRNPSGEIKLKIPISEFNSGIYTFEISNDLEAVRKKIVVAH